MFGIFCIGRAVHGNSASHEDTHTRARSHTKVADAFKGVNCLGNG